MTPAEKRVEAYIRDWHQRWVECGGEEVCGTVSSSVMERWKAAIDGLAKEHWTDEIRPDLGYGFGRPPEHDPANEKIRRAKVEGDEAVVETKVSEFHSSHYFEYRLKHQPESWRISSMTRFYQDEHVPSFAPEELNHLLEQPISDAPLLPPDDGDEPNCDVLFKEGHIIGGTLMRKPDAVRVRKVGRLSLPSGTIVVRDFGDLPEDARPLSLRVPAGEYDVEVCLLDRHVAASRILFNDSKAEPFSFWRAVTVDGDDSIIGVDGGNVAICDARAFMQRSKREHTRDYEAFCQRGLSSSGNEPPVSFMKLSRSEKFTAVISQSGHGDGGYPAFWVFDSQKRLVALVVDFLVAAEFLHRSVRLPWVPGQSGVIFQEPGVCVSVDPSQGIQVVGGRLSDIRWLDSAGQIVTSIQQMGSSHSGDEYWYYTDFSGPEAEATELEMQFDTGYRNKR